MDDESITGIKEFAVGNYLVQMVSDLIHWHVSWIGNAAGLVLAQGNTWEIHAKGEFMPAPLSRVILDL